LSLFSVLRCPFLGRNRPSVPCYARSERCHFRKSGRVYSITVTGLVSGKLFFPHSEPLIGVLEAFGVYFVGFIARPIGAAIFGHYGDRIGRKGALIATLLMIGIATAAVGLVPTYASIGIWGTVILTIIRFIQGIGASGRSNAHSPDLTVPRPPRGSPAG
jgi:MFS family permease